MKALVTGGGGFLGGAIVGQLVERGDGVSSFSRGEYPALEKLGVHQYRGDLSDEKSVVSAAEGCDIIFHVAGKPGVWGDYGEYYQTNFVGTQHVLSACKKHKIQKLVYTSTPSVVYHSGGIEGGNESLPYADHYDTPYPQTKMLAEKLVLESNGPHLATVALRPHLIWGPGDNHLVPRILARGKAGQLRRIGREDYLVDSVYIDNAARAHLLAGDHLSPHSPVAGKAYFISNDEPVPLWDLINWILDAGGAPPVEKTISPKVAYMAGWILEWLYKLFRIKGEPKMTRFVAHQLSSAHWFDISAAKKDFSYDPTITIQEGLKRLRESLNTSKIK